MLPSSLLLLQHGFRVTDRPAEGDLALLFESFSVSVPVYLKAGAVFQNKHGSFHHNDMIGAPWGTQVCVLVRPAAVAARGPLVRDHEHVVSSRSSRAVSSRAGCS
jgi:hypothetical protein